MSNDHFSSTTTTHNGAEITIQWFYDFDMGAPWEEHDGHGIVSEWTTRDKRAGELVLCEDRNSKRFYDFAETVKIALRDGWDAEPYNTGQQTKRQQAAKAARADFEYLRKWANSEWCWIGYTIEIDGFEYSESLWGIDSPSQAQFEEEAINDAKEWLDNETAESERAACQDIATV